MRAHVLTGSKQEIADQLLRLNGDVHEVIAFVDEPADPQADLPTDSAGTDIFAEMEPYMVRADGVDYTREAIYSRLDGE